MFSTTDTSRVHLPISFEGSNQQYWNCVRLCLQIPYFQICCSAFDREEFGDRLGTFLLSDLSQLIEILNDTNLDVLDVHLVSPGRINGTADWKMESLKTVWTGVEHVHDQEQLAFVFQLTNGKRYLDASCADDESELTSIKMLAEIEPSNTRSG